METPGLASATHVLMAQVLAVLATCHTGFWKQRTNRGRDIVQTSVELHLFSACPWPRHSGDALCDGHFGSMDGNPF